MPPAPLQISLFLAEPAGSPKVLLPQALDTALQLATSAELPGAEYWPRVHAFNLLRLAFTESQLSLDTSGYFAGAWLVLLVQVRDGCALRAAVHPCCHTSATATTYCLSWQQSSCARTQRTRPQWSN